MKKYLFISSFLALILFADYILIVLIAFVFNISGAESQFFYGSYKFIGLAIIGFSFLGAILYLRNALPKFSTTD